MNLFDNLKNKINDTAETVKNQSKDLTESMKDFNVGDSLKNAAKKSGEALENFKNDSTEFIKNTAASIAGKDEEPTELLTTDAAIKIMYYLMSVDNEITPEEEEKFLAIGKDMDPDFEEHRDALVNECRENLAKVIDEDDLYDTVHDSVGDLIRETFQSSSGSIPPILMVWNLLATAYSEGDYSEDERRLIRYITRQLNVDKSTLDIMEQTVETMIALEKEEAWLKTTNRPYLEIEKNLNEIADRKTAIMQSVQALMLD